MTRLYGTVVAAAATVPSTIPASAVVMASTTTMATTCRLRAAIGLADREDGSGLSMRRVAAELDVRVMNLYSHVRGRDELVDLMVDTVFGAHPLPEPGPGGWRVKLELSARYEWKIYLAHDWVAPLVATTTRPPLSANLMAYSDWRMRALEGQGLGFTGLTQVATMMSTFTLSAGLSHSRERQAMWRSGLDRRQWFDSRRAALDSALSRTWLPMVSRFGEDAYRASEPEAIFEFGLQRMLDGVAVLIDSDQAAT